MSFDEVYNNKKKWHIINGDAYQSLKQIPDNVFQTTVTSPPYFHLRDYENDSQIGQEESPKEYIENLVKVFREVKRCTREDGTCWINLGDKYCVEKTYKELGLKTKDMMGLPFELAFALRQDGWCLRQIYPWVKINAVPENVWDRPNSNIEYILFLSKSNKKYYFDMESAKSCLAIKRNWRNGDTLLFMDVPTERSEHPHFAVMPKELVKIMIKSTTSEFGCCKECHSPLTRICKKTPIPMAKDFNGSKSSVYYETVTKNSRTGLNSHAPRHLLHTTVETIKWDFSCSCCSEEKSRQLVLDPFAGSGTTGSLAIPLNNNFIGIELNKEYADYAINRLTNENQQEDIFNQSS